jgi:hypothetical protein
MAAWGQAPLGRTSGGHTLKWLKVKQRDYHVDERGWEPAKK